MITATAEASAAREPCLKAANEASTALEDGLIGSRFFGTFNIFVPLHLIIFIG
jgi:hypothetical protein